MREVSKLLESHKLDPTPVGLFDFMESGIELREYAKFEFSRNLSDILELIADFGERHGICIEDLAYSDINVFKELYISSSNPRMPFLQILRGVRRDIRRLSLLLFRPLSFTLKMFGPFSPRTFLQILLLKRKRLPK